MKAIGLMVAAGVMPVAAMAQQAPGAPATAQNGTPVPAGTVTDSGGGTIEEAGGDEEITVTGTRQPGSVVGDIPPDQTLNAADIRSYGVSSVSDLLAELEPQTRSGRGGPPVVLLNGKRISGFREIRDIPTEAIQRVEILPEEVALKYGYQADQRVVNFVLRRRFRALTAEVADRQSTDGGRNTPEGEVDLLRIRNDVRTNLHLEYQQSSSLLESQRDIVAAAGDNPANPGFDQRAFRTFNTTPQSRNFTANGVYARPFLGTSASINGSIETTESTGLFGLPVVALTVPAGGPFAAGTVSRRIEDADPLRQRRTGVTAHLGTTLNGEFGRWRWSFTGNYDRDESRTRTDTGLDTTAVQTRLTAFDPALDPRTVATAGLFGPLLQNRARSVSSQGGGDMLVNGTLFELPAGSVSTSFRIGASTSEFDSRSTRLGTTTTGSISRDIVNGQANIDLPIANRTRGGLEALGSLSANLNLGVDRLSDFGTLVSTGYGLNWSPIEGLRLIGSVTDQEQAPTAQQLGGPTVITPNARVFDYVRGTTATVTTISGGNPLLSSNDRHIERLGLTLKPWTQRDLVLTASYTRTKTDNAISIFPAAIASIERAFPDRVVRDASGQLLRLDTRPVNFARLNESELRWGFNFSKPLQSKVQRELAAFRAGTGPNPFAGMTPPGGARRPEGAGGGTPPAAGAAGAAGGGERGQGSGPRGPGGGFGGGGFGGGRGPGGGGGGRLNFAVYHTWHITNRVLIAESGPSLDLLNGDAIGANGGQPRHELEGQAGYTNNGLGARLSVNYRSPTDVRTLASTDDLRFSDLTTANLRLFVDFGGRIDWVRAHPWLRGARVAFEISNVFNQRQRVTDDTGTTPVSYQPDYRDPVGRTVRLSVRKLFF